MNNKVVVTIIAIFIVGAGGFFFINSQRGVEDTNGKPAAQSHRSYEIEVTSDTSNIQPGEKATIKYKIKNDKGEILKDFETVHEKIIHFIVVREDLQHFQHLHPEFNQSIGEFTVDITFPTDGPYRIFPDFTPGKSAENPMMLPVTVNSLIDVGDMNKYKVQTAPPDSQANKTFGEYQVTHTLPTNLTEQQEITFSLNITKDSKPVTNLENYLGALGHSVILKEGSLDFIHTHALENIIADSTQEHNTNVMQKETTTERGPDIEFATTFPEQGAYKIFTQFQHEGKIQTVDYVVRVN